jgi:hypothetical protein
LQKVTNMSANAGLSPATKNRLASLFQSFPKFGKGRKEDPAKRGRTAEDSTADPVQLPHQTVSGGGLSRGGSYSANSSPAKSAANGGTLSRPPSGLQRTRSMSSDNGFSSRGCSERGSLRSGSRSTTTSRYMQAAEAYKYKTLNAAPPPPSANGSAGSSTTWSASATKSRVRPSITADTFQSPPTTTTGRSASSQRTASASPAVHRRQQQPPPSVTSSSRSANSSIVKDEATDSSHLITSTHSTPSRKPPRQRSTTRDAHRGGGFDIETDEMILRRMEEILFTYKSKVEDRLAAEGKELPKDIFDDFTEHWVVNSAPYRAKSVDSLDSSDRSEGHQQHKAAVSGRGLLQTPASPRTAVRGPAVRKDPKEGHRITTRIPMPTFYSRSPIT